ncbi:hypothetical protein F4803DRAFT_524037 [Xylaria telfairii]|nr:hypothetical protein F4803DRAFT_524037 [Xylaria telfairii]
MREKWALKGGDPNTLAAKSDLAFLEQIKSFRDGIEALASSQGKRVRFVDPTEVQYSHPTNSPGENAGPSRLEPGPPPQPPPPSPRQCVDKTDISTHPTRTLRDGTIVRGVQGATFAGFIPPGRRAPPRPTPPKPTPPKPAPPSLSSSSLSECSSKYMDLEGDGENKNEENSSADCEYDVDDDNGIEYKDAQVQCAGRVTMWRLDVQTGTQEQAIRATEFDAEIPWTTEIPHRFFYSSPGPTPTDADGDIPLATEVPRNFVYSSPDSATMGVGAGVPTATETPHSLFHTSSGSSTADDGAAIPWVIPAARRFSLESSSESSLSCDYTQMEGVESSDSTSASASANITAEADNTGNFEPGPRTELKRSYSAGSAEHDVPPKKKPDNWTE